MLTGLNVQDGQYFHRLHYVLWVFYWTRDTAYECKLAWSTQTNLSCVNRIWLHVNGKLLYNMRQNYNNMMKWDNIIVGKYLVRIMTLFELSLSWTDLPGCIQMLYTRAIIPSPSSFSIRYINICNHAAWHNNAHMHNYGNLLNGLNEFYYILHNSSNKVFRFMGLYWRRVWLK